MVRIPVVLQTAETDCGPACLTALVRAFGRRATLAQLRDRVDPGRDGTSALTLRDVAGEWGVRLRPALAAPDELAAGTALLSLPAVVHLSRQHYVVADKHYRDGGLRVMDPAVGRRRMSPGELREQASGLVLIAEPVRSTADPGNASPPSASDSMASLGSSAAMSSSEPVSAVPRGPRLLTDVLRTVRKDLGGAAALSMLLALGGLGLPILTALIVDGLVANSAGSSRWLTGGASLAVLLALLALARYLLLASLQHRLAGALSTRVATTLFTRQLRFFDRRSVGDLYGRIESAHTIHGLLSVTLLGAVLDAVLTVGYLIALLVISPLLAGITATVVAVALAAALAVAHRSAGLRREEILVSADASTMLVDSITGVATLRVYGAEARVLSDWTQLLDRRLVLTRARARLSALSLSLLTGLAVVTPLLVLVAAAGTDGITTGGALGLMALATATLAPVASLASQLVEAADLRPLLDRLDDLELAAPQRGGGLDPGRLRGQITLRDVRFGYARYSGDVLGPIDAEVPAGSKIGVLGPTGCGKSTLAQLVCGLYEPTGGTVLLDGRELNELDLTAVRAQIGVVFQDNWLGTGCVREAVLAGREGYSDEEIWRALAHAHVADEIASLPLGLETRLGSGGSGLSGGQRQRLALARALLSGPAVLVLDEATSALDARTESLVDQTLAELRITRILITHRLGVVADADEIWVLSPGGTLAERGSPDYLLSQGGHYAELTAASTDGDSVRSGIRHTVLG